MTQSLHPLGECGDACHRLADNESCGSRMSTRLPAARELRLTMNVLEEEWKPERQPVEPMTYNLSNTYMRP